MAGIAAPVMIHLWNNKQGKVLAIGSIAFLEKTSRQKARSRKISEWLLLVLRCLLLLLLALLLAGPYWKKTPGAAAEKKAWVLVSGSAGEGEYKMKIDSFVKNGYERHDLPGDSWWQAFAALDRQAPAGIPFYVYTDGLLKHFKGRRPVTERPVYWHLQAVKDSVRRWVEGWPMGRDSFRTLNGMSGPTGNTFVYKDLNKMPPGMVLDTTMLKVAIYADEKYKTDGNWVAGAVRAVQQFTCRRIQLSMGDVRGANWVFWLSSKPIPAGLHNVLFYEQGQEIPVDTWIADHVQVDKVVRKASDGLEPVWTDGFGRALLGLERGHDAMRYHFFSHFDPAWNGMVWSPEFPEHLEMLLLSETDIKMDNRVIDPEQVTPSTGKPRVREDRSEQREAGIDLGSAGWLLIFLLVLAERILSFKKSRNG